MRGRLIVALGFVATAASAAPPEDATDPPQTKPVGTEPPAVENGEGGGPGETCASRQDCRAGLRCVAETCRDPHEGQTCSSTKDCGGELKCIRRICTSLAASTHSSFAVGPPAAAPEPKSEETEDDDWLGFALQGTHAFVGMTWGGGLVTTLATTLNTGFSTTTQPSSTSSTFLYALRAGVLRDKLEIALEIAPMTYLTPIATQCVPSIYGQQCAPSGGAVFEAAGTLGTWIPLVVRKQVGVYWPVRVGVGFLATTRGQGYFQAVGDLIGVNVRVGHLYFGMRLPSFRYAFTPDTPGVPAAHLLSWIFGGDVGYLF